MRIFQFFAIALLLGATTSVKAQDDKKEKVPVYNYVIDDPMDAFGRQPTTETVIAPITFPDFFSFKPKMVNDTTFRYECYNIYNEPIAFDSLHDIEAVKYISLIKSYNDPTETYVDASGHKKPLPIAKIVYRYDRIGDNKWLSVDYSNNKPVYLAEFKNSISRTDTTTTTDAAGNTKNTIHKYYKVLPEKK